MENTEPQPFNAPQAGRNTFLTVLCVLTFIGSGWGIVNGVRGYMTAEKSAMEASEAIEKAQDKMPDDSPGFMKNMMDSASATTSADNIRKSSIFSLFANLLTLAGAGLMFMLNKNGFYLYIAGTLIGVAMPMIVFGGMVGMFSAGAALFVGLIFCILYGVNLKQMH